MVDYQKQQQEDLFDRFEQHVLFQHNRTQLQREGTIFIRQRPRLAIGSQLLGLRLSRERENLMANNFLVLQRYFQLIGLLYHLHTYIQATLSACGASRNIYNCTHNGTTANTLQFRRLNIVFVGCVQDCHPDSADAFFLTLEQNYVGFLILERNCVGVQQDGTT